MSAGTYAVSGGPGNQGIIFEQVDALKLKIERMETKHERVVDDLEQRIKVMEDDKFQRDIDRSFYYETLRTLSDRMRKVEELGAGHTQKLDTKASTADRDLDRAAVHALDERVKKLEKPWFGGFGKTRAAQHADVSRLLRRMREFNSDMRENRVAHIKD